MIHLSFAAHGAGKFQLGQLFDLSIARERPDIEVRVLMQHHSILYPAPLTDWCLASEIKIFPESPGPYRLIAEWRGTDNQSGRESIDFEVISGSSSLPIPHRISTEDKVELWAPGSWEAKTLATAEEETLALLHTWVNEGDVVFDVGANIGIYSLPLSRIVGPAGHVFCFDANPVCIHYLHANLLQNRVSNATIVPAALLDVAGEARFNINYGNSNLGVVEQSSFFQYKLGHAIRVPSYRLDDLIAQLAIPAPAVVKIDVEGVEHLVIAGMLELLKKSSPRLFMELHGEHCARATLAQLEPLGYLFYDPTRAPQEPEKSEAIYARYPSHTVFRLLAIPR